MMMIPRRRGYSVSTTFEVVGQGCLVLLLVLSIVQGHEPNEDKNPTAIITPTTSGTKKSGISNPGTEGGGGAKKFKGNNATTPSLQPTAQEEGDMTSQLSQKSSQPQTTSKKIKPASPPTRGQSDDEYESQAAAQIPINPAPAPPVIQRRSGDDYGGGSGEHYKNGKRYEKEYNGSYEEEYEEEGEDYGGYGKEGYSSSTLDYSYRSQPYQYQLIDDYICDMDASIIVVTTAEKKRKKGKGTKRYGGSGYGKEEKFEKRKGYGYETDKKEYGGRNDGYGMKKRGGGYSSLKRPTSRYYRKSKEEKGYKKEADNYYRGSSEEEIKRGYNNKEYDMKEKKDHYGEDHYKKRGGEDYISGEDLKRRRYPRSNNGYGGGGKDYGNKEKGKEYASNGYGGYNTYSVAKAHRLRCSSIAIASDEDCQTCCRLAARRDHSVSRYDIVGFIIDYSEVNAYKEDEKYTKQRYKRQVGNWMESTMSPFAAPFPLSPPAFPASVSNVLPVAPAAPPGILPVAPAAPPGVLPVAPAAPPAYSPPSPPISAKPVSAPSVTEKKDYNTKSYSGNKSPSSSNYGYVDYGYYAPKKPQNKNPRCVCCAPKSHISSYVGGSNYDKKKGGSYERSSSYEVKDRYGDKASSSESYERNGSY